MFEAATTLGLFRDIHEAEYAVSEAIAEYSQPSQLRFLFAHLLLELPIPATKLKYGLDLNKTFVVITPIPTAF